MTAHSDRRWAELARELEFTTLPELRKQAEGWRTGLTGLTALLAVLVLLKGRDDLTALPDWARNTAAGLVMSSFGLLLIGSLLAVRAAHGAPGREILLGGQELRRWTEQEVSRVRRALGRATACCVLGVVLVVGALVLAWMTTKAAPTHPVELRTESGVVCGELIGADRRNITVRTEAEGMVVAPQATVVSVRPTPSCGATP
ncbi:hypothetical protein [Streptomyces sp. McG3]|uniref:hypothetical protein n=1 Tax=Streptomyces sp. McG3 TaxID=2725483 RepID=UPI001BE65B55|nr:hypothetical protein [Streptomyces sp. McG3]MBT2900879.1 hypothetical protein [Streptomyces sp. McG3]